jgi:uncharacterized membrane protein (UPF0127 family)
MTTSLSTLGRAAALLAVGFLVSLTPMAGVAQTMPLENLDHFPQTALTVKADGKTHRFTVWVANTPARQVQGLMFVRDLPSDQGMLFPMQPPRVAQFWMANTYIPLDMLFVALDGRIEKIVADATPFSLKTISSDVPVEAVIEIQGGLARKLGLMVGQRVRWTRPGAN